MIDIHSHILPGIDDGAKDFANSVEIVKELASQGVTDVVATPHYVTETAYTSPAAKNLKLLKELQKQLDSAKVPVRVHLGNEIYIDDDILDLVRSKKVSPLAGSKVLLVELPLSGDYPNCQDVIRDLVREGFEVILAHPERYTSFQRDFSSVEEMHEMDGVMLQCNLGSLIGQYGKKPYKLAREMMKRKMVFAFGSDIHHVRGVDTVALAKKKMKKYYSEAEIEDLLKNNSSKLLNLSF